MLNPRSDRYHRNTCRVCILANIEYCFKSVFLSSVDVSSLFVAVIEGTLIQINNISKQPPEMFYKKGVLKNFVKFTENTCTRVSFLTKLEACDFIKKETLARKTPFSQNTTGHLFVNVTFIVIVNENHISC